MKHYCRFGTLVAVVVIGALAGGAVLAAGVEDRLQIAPNNKVGVGIYGGKS